jgi:hypothetical protein
MRISLVCSSIALLSVVGCGSAAVSPPVDAATDASVDAADAAVVDAATDDSGPPPDPLATAWPREWTWVPIEGARCLNGSPTGIGVNLSPGSDGLVIFFMGGGACFNEETCRDAFHRDGFEQSQFRVEAALVGSLGPLARQPGNPMRDWNQVFIGYCTGDVHAGDNDRPVTVGDRSYVFTGYRNVRLALARVVPALRDVRRVLVTGVSAGGFGAAWNYDQIATAFGPSVDVSLVDDSGPPLGDAYIAPCLQRRWRTLWNLDATLPADCAACRSQADGGGISNLYEYLYRKYPTRRMGLISSAGDEVIRGFFSWGRDGDCARRATYRSEDLFAGLLDVRRRAAGTRFRTYFPASDAHTWLLFPEWTTTRVGGVQLDRWVSAIATGEGEVADVGP